MSKNFAEYEMRGDDTLDYWVQEFYGEDCDWVLLGQEEDFIVCEVLPNFTVLDDHGNGHKGIAIVLAIGEEFSQ